MSASSTTADSSSSAPRARSTKNPVSTYVASRLGQPHINLLPADAFGPARPPVPPRSASAPNTSTSGEGQPATIRRVEHLGDQTRLHLSLGPHDLITLTEPHTAPRTRRHPQHPPAQPALVRRQRQPHLKGQPHETVHELHGKPRHRSDRRPPQNLRRASSPASTATPTSASSSAPTGTAPRSPSSPAAAPATNPPTPVSSARAC